MNLCTYTYPVAETWYGRFFAVFLVKKAKSVVFPALNWPYIGLETQQVWYICLTPAGPAPSLTDHRVH